VTLPSDSSFKLSAKFSQQADIITDFPLTLTQLSTRPSPASRPSPAPAALPASDSAPAPTVEDPKVVAKVKTNKGTVVVDVSSFALRRIDGIHGDGDATIELASFSGTIHLRKQ